ncbi:MAG: (Fe-S)-binding protein [Candidatus Aminicenantia bacterium]
MLSQSEIVLFFFALSIALFAFFDPFILKLKLLLKGKKIDRFDRIGERLIGVILRVFLQKCSLEERLFTGIMHTAVFWGFVLFLLVTTNHVIEGFKKGFFIFGSSKIGYFFTFLIDTFAFWIILSCIYFFLRRFVFHASGLTIPSPESVTVLAFLFTAMITFIYYEAFKISDGEPIRGAFFGGTIASFLKPNETLIHFFWWAHILTIMGFGVYIPRSKHMHLLAGPINLFFRNLEPFGALKPLDLENSERFGIYSIEDFSWKDQLDSLACAECGRCDDYCPALNSGKPLSPKEIVAKVKKEVLKQSNSFLNSKSDELEPLMAKSYSSDEIWSCTTCGACEVTCPMRNEHIPKIIGLRQSEVLMEGRFPSELTQAFKNVETNYNPWGVGFQGRGDWLREIGVPTSAERKTEYLLFLGCAGSFEENGQKIVSSFVEVLKKAGVDFSILGKEEKCCGDPVRRAGNEYLFQTLAFENIETFRKYGIEKIVTICPHGYHTFKNEYPLLGFEARVYHHTEFIETLIKEGKISVKSLYRSGVFHDPCYLGRHSEKYREPREILMLSGVEVKELRNNRKHSFCCGAGGGLFWTEEKIGKRINHIRAEEVISSQEKVLFTACPFCKIMLKDGLKDKGRDDIKVLDIVEALSQ